MTPSTPARARALPAGRHRGTLWAAAACGVQVGVAMAASRLVVTQVPALAFAGLRYATAGLLLWLVTLALRGRDPTPLDAAARARPGWGLTAILAIGQFAAVVACINYGLRHIDSAAAALVFNLLPLFAMVTAVAIGQERLHAQRVAGLLLALLGVGVCIGPGVYSGSTAFVGGVLLVLLGAACGAVASVLSRPYLQGVAPLDFAVRAFVAATVALALASAAIEQPWTALGTLSLTGWLVIAGIGLSSAIGYWCWLFALKHDHASRVTVFQALGPPSAALCGAWWMGEPLTVSLALAMLLIACGLGLATR